MKRSLLTVLVTLSVCFAALGQWSPVGNFPNQLIFGDLIHCTTTDASGNVYAGGYFGNFVAKWDGNAWAPVGSSTALNGAVWALATDTAGNIYAGGWFSNANGNTYVAKWDGSSWSELGGAGVSHFNGLIRTIKLDGAGNLYAGGDFLNDSGKTYLAKWNGVSWSEVGGANTSQLSTGDPAFISSITTDSNGNVYASGQLFNSTFSYYVAKWDGTSWSELGGPNSTFFVPGNGYYGINALATDASGNIYAGGDFLNSNGVPFVAKWNGTAWSELGGSNSMNIAQAYFGILSISVDAGGNVYAAGDIGNSNYYDFIAKWDGTAWSEVGGTNSFTYPRGNWAIEAICNDASGNLYAVGDFRNSKNHQCVVKWNGSTWGEVGSDTITTFNENIYDIATDSSGNIYAAGYFTGRYGWKAVSQWNGSDWEQLYSPPFFFNNTILCLAAGAPGTVYAGGFFTNTFFNGRYFVAKWDGAAWGAVDNDSVFNGPIQTLATDNGGMLYAAGVFTNGPDPTLGNPYVAKWDGTTWSEVGGAHTSSFDAGINCVVPDGNGNLYVAGGFRNNSGNRYVAKWNGSTWSEVGGAGSSIIDNNIFSVAFDVSGNVYAGGMFINSSGNFYVAHWNGSTWSELGGANTSTFNGFIRRIVVDASGNVYVSGDFTDANGKSYVAKWDGVSWSRVGTTSSSEFNGDINTLKLDNAGNLLAAGDFTLDGVPYPTRYVSRYNNTTGIDVPSSHKTLSCYPNPATDHLTVHATADLIGKRYRVYDLSGRIVLTGMLIEENTILPLNALHAGLYHLTIDGRAQQMFKLVKE